MTATEQRRIVRPRPGQIWALGSADGRPDTIKNVIRSMTGHEKMENGIKVFKALPGSRAVISIEWHSDSPTIRVRKLWENWVYVGCSPLGCPQRKPKERAR